MSESWRFFFSYCKWSWYFGEVDEDINICLKPLCECCLACLFCQPPPSNSCPHSHTDECWLPVELMSLLLHCTNTQTGPCTHTHKQQSLSLALVLSVMHYRPLSYFADLRLSSGLNLLSTQTDTHMHTVTTLTFYSQNETWFPIWVCLTALCSLLPPSFLSPSFPKSVLMWLGLCACFLHAVFLCLFFFLFTFSLLSNPPSSLCCYSWGSAMLGFFSMHFSCVLIHFINPSLHGRLFSPFLISSLALSPCGLCLSLSHHSTLSSLLTLTQCHFLSKLDKRSRAKGISACLMKRSSHFTCLKAWAVYFSVMFIYICARVHVLSTSTYYFFITYPYDENQFEVSIAVKYTWREVCVTSIMRALWKRLTNSTVLPIWPCNWHDL